MISKIVIAFLLIIISLTLVSFYFLSPPMANNKTKYSLIIEKGDGVSEIADKLKEKNLIKNTLFFKIFVKATGKSSRLQAGTYKLSSSENLSSIVNSLSAGKTEDVTITIPEGLRREEIADTLGSALGEKVKEEFLTLTKNLEGHLFPDTYFVKRDTDAEEIITKMTDNFEAKFKDILVKTNLSKNETITLASIIERETKHDEDRALVSGILYKRIMNNWPLEADATIQYALGFWKKTLTAEDLNLDSPFNTRKNLGLPPSPITNPGLKSLIAAANPINSSYWFYLSDLKGNMHYAKTMEEHEANIVKYIDK